ncbi:MAG TPA: hypothetical protein VFE51_22405 [Verrucomicrobiae bacterium]|nr:hypothetical protein [Verrucomicrobiae bacterium]
MPCSYVKTNPCVRELLTLYERAFFKLRRYANWEYRVSEAI